MRNLKSGSVCGAIFVLMCGCSPRVLTEINKRYPVIVSPEEVRVYGLEDSVPVKAEIIGKVAVLDGGTSMFNYQQALVLARRETSEVGGNIFAVTDRVKPSFWGSSCDQITGYMLLAHDSLPAVTMGENRVMELRREAVAKRERLRIPAHMLYANVGYGHLFSKFYLPNGCGGNPRNGINWSIGYDWTSKQNVGVGLFYSGYRSQYSYGLYNVSVLQHYIGAKLLFKQRLSEKWLFEEEIGVGFAGYREHASQLPGYSLNGLGANVGIGTTYMVAPNVGVGMNIGYVTSSLPDQELVETEENTATGLFQFYVNGGIRFFF